MKDRDILIVAPDAAEHLPFLEGMDAHIATARTAAGARAAWNGQAIVLGQPDLVAEALDCMDGLLWVQSTWAGVTPLLESPRRDYLLTGVKEVFGGEMSEFVLGYLLARELRLLERFERQRARDWWPQPSGTLNGRTVCILGTGSIGQAIAASLKPFGARLLGYSRSGAPLQPFEHVYSGEDVDTVLAQADYLVCILPDTPETRGLLDARRLSLLRSDACLVNVGRGTLIDENALADALNAGRLGGAVLDVFQQEPLPPESPLWNARNTLITAHMAARSRPRSIAALFRENYRRFINGEPLEHVVDFGRGY